MASVALTFFAYLGFAVISFTAGDLRDPARELPRAMYLGIGLTAAIYVLISLGTFGALTPAEVERYGDTALAQAAEPSLGEAGLRDDVDRRPARHLVVGQRERLRRREHHVDARARAAVPPVFGGRARGGPTGCSSPPPSCSSSPMSSISLRSPTSAALSRW